MDVPSRKPMASVRRVALFDREIRLTLSKAAVEILFETADTLSEGEVRGGGYFGSTMITLDLERAAASVREPCDVASAKTVAELVVADERVRARALGIAAGDARERAATPLAELATELRSRAVGTRVHLDVDVEGLVESWRRGAGQG